MHGKCCGMNGVEYARLETRPLGSIAANQTALSVAGGNGARVALSAGLTASDLTTVTGTMLIYTQIAGVRVPLIAIAPDAPFGYVSYDMIGDAIFGPLLADSDAAAGTVYLSETVFHELRR